jgi:hypothetical protein
MSPDEADRQPFELRFTIEGNGEEVETFDHWDKVLVAGQGDGRLRRALGCEAADDDRPVAGATLARPEALESSCIRPEQPRVQRFPLAAGAFKVDDHPSARVRYEGSNGSIASDDDSLERHRDTFAVGVPFRGHGCGRNRRLLLPIAQVASR